MGLNFRSPTEKRIGCGIGLRAPHIAAVLASRPRLPFIEVHAENHMGGGPATQLLEELRHDYAIALHGVGLSLGSAEPPDALRLARLVELSACVAPMLISEHLAWCGAGGVYLNDLLPVPYTEEALGIVARNIEMTQEALGRQILIENPSRYFAYPHSPIEESEFLAVLVRRTGCGLLLDINNLYVSACNLGFEAPAALARWPAEAIGEIHMAGHVRETIAGDELLIDTHGAPIAGPVWRLYERALGLVGPRPTLIERDKNIPELDLLIAEAAQAEAMLAAARAEALTA
jgi:hypothetical protein